MRSGTGMDVLGAAGTDVQLLLLCCSMQLTQLSPPPILSVSPPLVAMGLKSTRSHLLGFDSLC